MNTPQLPPTFDHRGSARVSGLSEIFPFLAFLGFAYIFLTMGQPDRPIWEQPAIANDGEKPIATQCVASNPSPGVYTWRDCKSDDGLK